MRDYAVQFLVGVQVEAPDIRTATEQTHISIKLTDAPPGETDCAVEWEYTKGWDEDGDVIEQWGVNGDSFPPDHEEQEDDDDRLW
jgi:hypothetical protein